MERLTEFERKFGIELERVSYGKKSTPVKDREYFIPDVLRSPVGTIKEWKSFGKENKKKILLIRENSKRRKIKI